jgi:hypothetical protein
MRLGTDLAILPGTPHVAGFQGQPLTAGGSASGQVYTYNSASGNWAPTVPVPSQSGAFTSALATTSISGGASAVLYTLSAAAPSAVTFPGIQWRAFIGYSVNYAPRVNGQNGIFTAVLTGSPAVSVIGNAVGGLNTLSTHTATVGSFITSGSNTLASGATLSLTLTGYAPQADITLSTSPDTGSGGGASLGGITVQWIQGS